MEEQRSIARPLKNRLHLRVSILLSVLIYGAFLSSIWFLMMLFLFREKHYGIWFLAALACWTVLMVMRYFVALGCLCPLCRGPFMGKKSCEMHEKARSHFGLSYRASLMIDVLARGWFVCPYCGTSFRLRR